MSRPKLSPARLALALCLSIPFVMGARCKKTSSRVPPLCAFDQATEEEVKSKTLPPMVWLKLVSPTVDSDNMTRTGVLRDTCGLVVQPLAEDTRYICENHPVTQTRVEGDQVEESDLVMSQIGEDRVLLWAATDEVGDDEASGILSLALWTEKGIEIHATGPMRGIRAGARLRLAYIGNFPVVILESDRCPPGAQSPGQCTRIAQFVPIIDRRVRELPLYEADRGCIGRAKFELSKKVEIELDQQWTRRFELVRSIEVEAGQIILTDLVTIDDYNRVTSSPPTPFRKVSARRPVELDLPNERLLLEQEDLWERVLRDHGSAHVEGGGPEQQEEPPGAAAASD